MAFSWIHSTHVAITPNTRKKANFAIDKMVRKLQLKIRNSRIPVDFERKTNYCASESEHDFPRMDAVQVLPTLFCYFHLRELNAIQFINIIGKCLSDLFRRL